MVQRWRLLTEIWGHPANHDDPIAAMARFVRWQLHKRLLGRPLDVPFHGGRLRVFPDSNPTSAAYYFNGLPDYGEMSFMLRYLRPGDRVVDVGANAGVYSLLAAILVGPDGVVDAFEPVRENLEKLRAQFALNGMSNLHIHEVAAAERDGTVEFGLSANSATGHIQAGETADGGSLKVRCVRMDGVIGATPFAFGKMDIEGAELLALQGAEGMLAAGNPPVWLLELGGYSRRFGVSSHQLVEFLKERGYDCALYDVQQSRLQFSDTPWTFGIENVIAVSRNHREQVAVRIAEAG